MSCPREEDLLLLDTLDESRRADVLEHARSCPACADRISTLETIDAALAGGDDPVPGHLLVAARALPDREPAAPAGRIRRLALAGAAVAAAAAALLAVIRPPPPAAPRPEPAPVLLRVTGFPEFPEPDLRTRVAAALAADGTGAEPWLEGLGDSILVLLTRFAGEDDAAVARAAIGRLGALGRAEALPALEAAVERPDRRAAAIAALSFLGDERAVPALAPLLADPEAGADAREAIAAIGGEAAARALAEHLRADLANEDAVATIDALARADGRGGARLLLALLDLPDRRADALAAVAAHREVLYPHLLALAGGRDRTDARRALRAIGFLAPPEAVPALRGLLGERDRRDAAARALVRIDTPEAGEALLSRHLTDPVREAFRDAGPGLVAWLAERTRGGDTLSQLQAIELLGLAGRPEAVPALESLARHRALAPAALTALGRIGGAPAVLALDRLSAEPALARGVITALGDTGAQEAVPVLLRIGRSEASLRNAAAVALASIQDASAVEALILLEPGKSAMRILGTIDPRIARPALRAMLDGEHEPAARAALKDFVPPPPRGNPRGGRIQ